MDRIIYFICFVLFLLFYKFSTKFQKQLHFYIKRIITYIIELFLNKAKHNTIVFHVECTVLYFILLSPNLLHHIIVRLLLRYGYGLFITYLLIKGLLGFAYLMYSLFSNL